MALISITRKADKKKRKPTDAQPVVEVAPDAVFVTPKAAEQICARAEKEGDGTPLLRVAVRGGGCSGLTYVFSFESASKPNDTLFAPEQEDSAARICVDPKSLKVLGGSILDYREELGRSGFLMRNPHASSSCSCGESFSL